MCPIGRSLRNYEFYPQPVIQNKNELSNILCADQAPINSATDLDPNCVTLRLSFTKFEEDRTIFEHVADVILSRWQFSKQAYAFTVNKGRLILSGSLIVN